MKPFSASSLALLAMVRVTLTTPTPQPPGAASVLEHMNANTPIAWKTVVNDDGTLSNFTVVETDKWNTALSELAARSVDTVGYHLVIEKREQPVCYGSGSWAKQATLNSFVSAACTEFSKGLHPLEFYVTFC
jgi:hypothetical protein